MEETVTFHSYSSGLTDATTKQHFEVKQPESSHPTGASSNFPRGAGEGLDLRVKAQSEAPFSETYLRQDRTPAQASSHLPWRHVAKGTVMLPSKIILHRGRFNKAERELKQLLAKHKADFYEAVLYTGLS